MTLKQDGVILLKPNCSRQTTMSTDIRMYLTRHYGEEAADEMIRTEEYPTQHVRYIDRLKANVPIELDFTDPLVIKMYEKYIKLNGKPEILSQYDKKMIKTMVNLHNSYEVHTFARNETQETEAIQAPIHKKPVSPPKKEPKPRVEKTICRCQAYKMDNTICNAKTDGSRFCKRHAKKQQLN